MELLLLALPISISGSDPFQVPSPWKSLLGPPNWPACAGPLHRGMHAKSGGPGQHSQ